MKLTLRRTKKGTDCTLGELYADNAFLGHTLEDVVRDLSDPKNKVHGKTAIPAGKYEVVLTYSNRFSKMMPLLLNVPNFDAIRIHGGNTKDDTEGCPLLGSETNGKDRVSNCAQVNAKLNIILQDSIRSGKVFIEVIDVPAVAV